MSSNSRGVCVIAVAALIAATSTGCEDPSPKKAKQPVTKRKTQDIRDSSAEQSKGAVARPVGSGGFGAPGGPQTALGSSYTAGVSVASGVEIKSGIDAYYAENFDYPKSHQDFMDNVVKKYNIRLAELPRGQKYAYNVEKHVLEILTYPADQANLNAPPPQAPAQDQSQPGLPGSLKGLPTGT